MSTKNSPGSSLSVKKSGREILFLSYDKSSNQNIFSKILHYSQFNYYIIFS